MIIQTPKPLSECRIEIAKAYLSDEQALLSSWLSYLQVSDDQIIQIQNRARGFIEDTRLNKKRSSLESLLSEFSLDSEEGVALMCMAESLLRIPDPATRDALIKDKLTLKNWSDKAGKRSSTFINATTWVLMLTGRILNVDEMSKYETKLAFFFNKLLAETSEPVVRIAISKAMHIVARQFVMAETIEKALDNAKDYQSQYRFSFDMLGEGARTKADAEQYYLSYQHAIKMIAQKSKDKPDSEKPSISIKLSALDPCYRFEKIDDIHNHLIPKIITLCEYAKENAIGLTIDAEETFRLDTSLDLIESILDAKVLQGWKGFGVAVQAYQKRGFYVLEWLGQLAKMKETCINVRLIKGAYWDTEIKRAQVLGLESYPVFTKKSATDIAYMACTKKLLEYQGYLFPQFATHNALTIATIIEMAQGKNFEFQRLYGMGESLYDNLLKTSPYTCRIYAPVGSYASLLPYLIRRILENGANTSFVHKIANEQVPIDSLIRFPSHIYEQSKDNLSSIPKPLSIYPQRLNSKGFDITQWHDAGFLKTSLDNMVMPHKVDSLVTYTPKDQSNATVKSPIDDQVLCQTSFLSKSDVGSVMQVATDAFPEWTKKPLNERVDLIRDLSDKLESNMHRLIYLLIEESGKVLTDAVAEIREAIDFCRYYAQLALSDLAPRQLHGYTGEHNILHYHGKGAIVCISPWNFPCAIFVGQIAAALITGNTVVAKPAEQSHIIAHEIISWAHEVGIPKQVLQLVYGKGEVVGDALTKHPLVDGVLFTGSTEVARQIQINLAHRNAPIATLVAETGGVNAMVVDSSALLERVVDDIVHSSFLSAGQRCSALRVLFIQEEIFEPLCKMLRGAMDSLAVGDPRWLHTDIGPVIDKQAQKVLASHVEKLRMDGCQIYQKDIPLAKGSYFPPTLVYLENLQQLTKEVFGPILHVWSYKIEEIQAVYHYIRRSGFGLTLGVASRINRFAEKVIDAVPAGNYYVNRNMTGAVVGVQPFGGEGYSGTGPKAGGPHYLHALVRERITTVDITATGGNAELLASAEE